MPRDKRIDSVLMAKYLIHKAQEKDITDMSIVKLQKLLYALDGVLLANNINIIDEHCHTWKYGPVYPKVFNNINNDDFNKDYSKEISIIKNNKFSKEIDFAVDKILNTFGKYSSSVLSAWSHEKGSPWLETKERFGENTIIPKDLLKNYFSKQ